MRFPQHSYCEALGAETLAHLQLSDGTLAVVRFEGDAPVPAAGSEHGIACDERRLHFFDGSGRRIADRA